MKKIYLLGLIIISLFTFNSCGDTYYTTVEPSPKMTSESFYFNINKNDWIKTEDYHWYLRINVPSITISTIDNGAVLVYYKNNVNTWVLLPYTTTFVNQRNELYNEEIWFGYALGTIDIDYVYTNSLDPTPTDLNLKVVVINYN